MRTQPFGQNGLPLPVIGQGTWMMERDVDPVAALKLGIELGMTHIDTAEMYGSGRVEEIVGKAIAGQRQEVYLVSKVLPSNASGKGAIQACERSLKKLGTDYLDLYLLHWPGSHPLPETYGAFDKLIQAGKIRSCGVSNFDVADIEDLARLGLGGITQCNQVLYNPTQRIVENEVLPECRKHGISVVAYSPLDQGAMPPANSDAGRALTGIAKTHGVTEFQVALAFLIRVDDVFAIPKASDKFHVADNAAAADLELSERDISELESALPRARAGTPLPMN